MRHHRKIRRLRANFKHHTSPSFHIGILRFHTTPLMPSV
jgi:hypothetical protein